MTPSLAGVVLAAGASRRMGAPKAALRLGDATLIGRVLDGLAGADVAPIVVVTGLHHDAVAAAMPVSVPVQVVINPTPERGQLSSLKVGLRALLAVAPAAAGAVVALVDHPMVARDTVGALARAAREGGHAVLVPTHGGQRGHPIVLMRALWGEVLATPDDASARVVVRRDPSRVREVPVDDPGILVDVDTAEDLAALVRRLRDGGLAGAET
jgi:CTP:molybdopterin cytidylyltransferase MocA